MSTSVTVTVPNHLMARLVGPLNENLRLVEDAFPGTRIIARGNEFTIDGDDAAPGRAPRRRDCACCSSRGHAVDPQVVHRTIDMVRADERPSEVLTAEVLRSARGRSVRPKTSGQKRYADAIRDNIDHLRGRARRVPARATWPWPWPCRRCRPRQVDRIILTRPGGGGGGAPRVPAR